MIKINWINIYYLCILFMLVDCSSYKSVASKPVTQSQFITQHVIVDKKITKKNIKFNHGSFIAISELSSRDGILIAKANNIYQSKTGDLIFTKDTVLKFKCDNNNATITEINNNQFEIPVLLQNKDHVQTGCEKYNGAIKFAKIK